MELENDQSLIDRNTKEESSQMEEVQETIRRESDTASINYQQVTTEESEDDILLADSDSSLERSIWAPNKDRYEEKRTLKAKVAAIKVLGNNPKHREKSLRWSIGKNVHLKKVSEKFENGNLWCIVTFDCMKGYEEAKQKLENNKEEYEQANLILEEDIEEETLEKAIKNSNTSNSAQEFKRKREEQAEKELKEVFLRRKERGVVNTHELNHSKKKEVIPFQANKNSSLPEDDNKITVWDLPVWARRTQVFEMVRFLGRVEHIEMIKSASDKTRAEIEFQTGIFDKKK